MSDPNVSPDSQFTNIALQQHVMDHAMSLDGPSANQVAAIQEDGLLDGLEHLGLDALGHSLGELFEGAAAAAAAVSAGVTLYALTSGWNRAWEEGDALNHAHQRDAVTLAIIEAGAAALPAGYVSKMMNEYKDVAGKGGADKVLTAAMASGKWDELKAQAEASITAGRDAAGKAKITTPEALAARLQADPTFAARYHQDTAFRVGVQSVVYYGHA